MPTPRNQKERLARKAEMDRRNALRKSMTGPKPHLARKPEDDLTPAKVRKMKKADIVELIEAHGVENVDTGKTKKELAEIAISIVFVEV